MQRYGIALHGGAGTIRRQHMTPEREAAYRQGLADALDAGYGLLEAGAPALDAVEACVRVLEDNPLFNAGKGAVFAADGTHLLDASIMRGDTLQAGAAANVRGVRNPITLARRIMEASAYVMMTGEGAEAFARSQGIAMEPAAYFYDELRYQQWQSVADQPVTMLDHADKGEKNFSTVGAVALDRQGHLAAATSTGGMTNKRYGRVGDSPLIGAGTYADDQACAVCCTGHGEPFIRLAVAHHVAMLVRYGGRSLDAACRELIFGRLPELQGEGGLIAIGAQGNTALIFNTEGMYRASRSAGGPARIALYSDESEGSA